MRERERFSAYVYLNRISDVKFYSLCFVSSGLKPLRKACRARVIRHKEFVPGVEAASAVSETIMTTHISQAAVAQHSTVMLSHMTSCGAGAVCSY
jgi:hypothetical protein